MERTFDHEKLDVYQIELQFIAWLTDFFLEVSKSRAARCRELFEQLDRASLSALLNTAEGNGKRQGRQRAKFFDDARGSAIECAACLDATVAKPFVSPNRIQPGKEMLGRVVAMLTRLVTVSTRKNFYIAVQFEGLQSSSNSSSSWSGDLAG